MTRIAGSRDLLCFFRHQRREIEGRGVDDDNGYPWIKQSKRQIELFQQKTFRTRHLTLSDRRHHGGRLHRDAVFLLFSQRKQRRFENMVQRIERLQFGPTGGVALNPIIMREQTRENGTDVSPDRIGAVIWAFSSGNGFILHFGLHMPVSTGKKRPKPRYILLSGGITLAESPIRTRKSKGSRIGRQAIIVTGKNPAKIALYYQKGFHDRCLRPDPNDEITILP